MVVYEKTNTICELAEIKNRNFDKLEKEKNDVPLF